MKRLAFILVIVSMIVLAGCGKDEKLTLDSKHKELPGYVKNTSELIQETYIMAATYPEVLASVPCYCGCGSTDGHVSNLDCFVGGMDKNNAVVEWDQMGVAWDVCVDIAREAVEMNKDGKSLKEINSYITKKYEDFGEPTPTPTPK